jgi:hypothetical protein
VPLRDVGIVSFGVDRAVEPPIAGHATAVARAWVNSAAGVFWDERAALGEPERLAQRRAVDGVDVPEDEPPGAIQPR